jgi:hypothetical protein
MVDLPNVGEDSVGSPGSAGMEGQAAKESQALSSHHEKLAEVLVRMERQRYWLRLSVCVAALVAAIAAGVLEWILLQHLLQTNSETGGVFVLLAIAPIVSITIIVIGTIRLTNQRQDRCSASSRSWPRGREPRTA